MIIDFHTHSFPDALAGRAVEKLAKSAGAKNYLDGTLGALERSMREAGIDMSVLLPVVTRPGQQEEINRIAMEINERSGETGVLSFGGIHPDNGNYRDILRTLRENGVKGIKIHPVFQRTNLDDIRYMRIIACACENDMIVTTHAGYDISYPGEDFSGVSRISALLDAVKPDKFVLAHMGGWNCWREAEEELLGRDVWLDTSFSLLPVVPLSGTMHHKTECSQTGDAVKKRHLSKERFLGMVRRHGADKVLFGTDSPWGGQKETLDTVKKIGLGREELESVLGRNAVKLLEFPI